MKPIAFVRACQWIALLSAGLFLGGCRPPGTQLTPVITFSKVPPADVGGPDKTGTIAGRVSGARPQQRIVIFAKSGQWWVQPNAAQPFTNIQSDASWTNATHLGTEYAALLVEPGYLPPVTTDALPSPGGAVIALATTPGQGTLSDTAGKQPAEPRRLQFSGYEWEARQMPSPRGGTPNNYDPANAWTDAQGYLHLRIAKSGGGWSCAEVSLRRSLGYGSYIFVVQNIAHLEPAAVLGLYTWDDLNAEQNHRELDLEFSRWGDPLSKNAQYAIQPYYVPVNMFRFVAPPGVLTHSLRWEPGRVAFHSWQGRALSNQILADSSANARARVIAEHAFTSGVPSPGNESVRLSLYVYGKTRTPLQNEAEVIIEKFEYLP